MSPKECSLAFDHIEFAQVQPELKLVETQHGSHHSIAEIATSTDDVVIIHGRITVSF